MAIADVQLKNNMYCVLDENGKDISHDWESSLGDFKSLAGKMKIQLLMVL